MISAIDVPDVYLVPRALSEQGLDAMVCEKLGLPAEDADLADWDALIERIDERRESVEIASSGSTSSSTTRTSRCTRR